MNSVNNGHIGDGLQDYDIFFTTQRDTPIPLHPTFGQHHLLRELSKGDLHFFEGNCTICVECQHRIP